MEEHRFQYCRVVINPAHRWLSTKFDDGAELGILDDGRVAIGSNLGQLRTGS
jgi:hypothetical protein